MNVSYFIIACLMSVLFSACSFFLQREDTKKEAIKEFGPTGIPPELRAKKTEEVTLENGSPASEVNAALAQHTKAEDIIWTNFDDTASTSVAELQTLFQKPKKVIWEKNEGQAKRNAIREGKCLMILFTNSRQNPLCKILNNELLGKKEFGDWAEEKLIRLEVDGAAQMATGEKHGEEVRSAAYVADMKKRYKVLGSPVIIMLSPQGEILGRYSGYKKGQESFLWGQIKQAERIGSEQYQEWSKTMERRGYRHWTDTNGTKVLAQLTAYREGQLILIEPDGNRFRCKESQLSQVDKDWIAQEKKKRAVE